MKKSFSIILCTIIMIMIATGCQSKQQTQETSATTTTAAATSAETSVRQTEPMPTDPVELNFWGWGGGAEQQIYQTVINKFKEKYSNITINYTLVDSSQYSQKLTTAIAGGKAPDVFYVTPNDFLKYVRSNVLANLSQMIDKSELLDVWPQAIKFWSTDGKTPGQGDLYALPKDISALVMMYNKTLMEQCGVTPPDPKIPWTWDQFLDACQKMTKDTNGDGKFDTYGCGGIPYESVVYSFGGTYLTPDRKRVNIDAPEFIQGLQFFVDLKYKYQVAADLTQGLGDWVAQWLGGTLGITRTGAWEQAYFWGPGPYELKFEWDIAQWPVDSQHNISHSVFGTLGIGVYSKTINMRAAVELTKYLTLDPEGQKQFCDLGLSITNLMSMANSDFLQVAKPPMNRAGYLDGVKNTSDDLTIPYYDSKWMDTFNQDMSALLTGKSQPEEWAKAEQLKLQKLYEEGGNVPQ